MSPRERTIAIALLAGVMLAAGAFLFHQFYLMPLRDREESVRMAQAARDSQQERFDKVTSQKDILDQWRKLSLPSDDFCQLEYYKLLDTMMKTSGFADIVVRASDGPDIRRGLVLDKSFYTPLTFTVSGHGNLSQVVKLLEQFYKTPLLHKIKFLSIRRPTTPNMGDLEIEFRVEAIIVSGAENRSTLVPDKKVAPDNLANPPRDYAAIAAKDIFYGPPPQQQKPDEGPDPALAVILRMITYDDEKGFQANLYNDTDKTSCWLCPGSGFVRFEIRSKRKLWHEGEVISIDLPGGKVVFRAEDKHYAIHLDQTLGEALRKPLSEVQVRELILTRAPGSNGAQ